MSYWQDEDVNHFMISQLLSKKGDEKGKVEQPASIHL